MNATPPNSLLIHHQVRFGICATQGGFLLRLQPRAIQEDFERLLSLFRQEGTNVATWSRAWSEVTSSRASNRLTPMTVTHYSR